MFKTMCLIKELNSNPILVEKPITVYKICIVSNKKIVTSEINNFHYHKGIINYENFEFNYKYEPYDMEDSLKINDFVGVENIDQSIEDSNRFSDTTNDVLLYLTRYFDIPLISVTRGFHFAFNKDRLLYNLSFEHSNYKICKFEIPVNSFYFKGIDSELGVTNKIIFQEICE